MVQKGVLDSIRMIQAAMRSRKERKQVTEVQDILARLDDLTSPTKNDELDARKTEAAVTKNKNVSKAEVKEEVKEDKKVVKQEDKVEKKDAAKEEDMEKREVAKVAKEVAQETEKKETVMKVREEKDLVNDEKDSTNEQKELVKDQKAVQQENNINPQQDVANKPPIPGALSKLISNTKKELNDVIATHPCQQKWQVVYKNAAAKYIVQKIANLVKDVVRGLTTGMIDTNPNHQSNPRNGNCSGQSKRGGSENVAKEEGGSEKMAKEEESDSDDKEVLELRELMEVPYVWLLCMVT